MKLLPLLFLFLSVACYGQDVVVSGSGAVAIIFDSKKQADSFEVVRKKPKNNTLAKKVLSLEEKLLLYASECYNDSSKMYLCCDRNTGYEVWNGKYIHREPTFEGFIEYLKKKQP